MYIIPMNTHSPVVFGSEEITEMLSSMALREGGSSTRIDAAFDNYREIWIKSLQRGKRGAEMGNTCRNIRPEYMYRSEGFFGPA